MDLNTILAFMAVLMLGCLLSSKISSFLNMPCLLLFLGVGMLCGHEGINILKTLDYADPANISLANYIGSASLAFILFSGGFDTEWKTIKPVFKTGSILSSLGVLLTALFTGIFIYLVAPQNQKLSFAWCFLLGSVISSTDAAAVFSILRSKSVSLKGKLQPLLEFESGSNDPMAAFLTIFLITIVSKEQSSYTVTPWFSYLMIFPNFLLKMSIGILMGYLLGRAFIWLYNKINFDYNGLYYVLGIVVVLLTYSFTELAQGNGFMAVYVAGMVMGNNRFVFHNGVGRFYDGLAWMMQVILFTMLGLFAAPSGVWAAKWNGLLVALFLMFIARPLATFICMWKSPFTIPERLLVSWVGLRGGAPIMLATFPLISKIENSQMMFNIVFFIVLTSVLLQGMTIMPLAKKLHLDGPLRKIPRIPLSFEETGDDSSNSCDVSIPPKFNDKTIAELKMPEGVLILLIRRDQKFLVPRGDTSLKTNDVLTLMGDNDKIQEMLHFFQ